MFRSYRTIFKDSYKKRGLLTCTLNLRTLSLKIVQYNFLYVYAKTRGTEHTSSNDRMMRDELDTILKEAIME